MVDDFIDEIMSCNIHNVVWIATTVVSLAFGDFFFFLVLQLRLIGIVSNVAAMGANSGLMPVRLPPHRVIEFYVLASEKHCLMDESTRLRVLADIIPKIPLEPNRWGRQSIGDICLRLGMLAAWVYYGIFIARIIHWVWG